VLWNTFNFGGTNTVTPDQFKLEVGGYNPLLGKSYGEIAAESRTQHKSQGFGSGLSRGESQESFRTLNGPAPVNDIMEGIDLSWRRVTGGETIGGMIEGLVATFDFLHPEKTVNGLTKVYQAIKALPESPWKIQKAKEVEELLVQCSGLFLDATSNMPYAVQTDSIRINFSFNNRLGDQVILRSVTIDGFDTSFSKSLERNRNLNFFKTLYVPQSKKISQPYWLEQKMEEGYFVVSDPAKIGQPDSDPGYEASIVLDIAGQQIEIRKAVKYKYTDPVKGEIYQPLHVVPAYTVKIKPEMMVKSGNLSRTPYEWSVVSNKSSNNVRIKREKSSDLLYSGSLAKGQVANFMLPYEAVHIAAKPGRSTEAIIDAGNSLPAMDVSRIEYDHVPTIIYFKPSVIAKNDFNYAIAGKSIGYIPGAGDKVPQALEQMGYEVTLLTDKELNRNSLARFDAIITGIRAYNTNDWMNDHYDKLMDYVSKGGNLIVQYNTSTNLGPVKARIFPYQFNISRTRITDENAQVSFINPAHRVLNFPNKISQEDFKGWVQERSIYHATGWDSTKFEPVFIMNDPGERPDNGSLIIGKHGKGVLVYSGLVFFRELPAAVPGAFRLMANIIALNKK
jgi:hypothetical protein